VSGSGISWTICKSAPRSRQITMPAPHHSVFLQTGCPSFPSEWGKFLLVLAYPGCPGSKAVKRSLLDALPAAQPTAPKQVKAQALKARKKGHMCIQIYPCFRTYSRRRPVCEVAAVCRWNSATDRAGFHATTTCSANSSLQSHKHTQHIHLS